MTHATILFLPDEGAGYRWWRLAGDRVVARGEGVPDLADGDAAVAVPPADAVALHWAELPARSPAQALAAARLLVADASAAPVGELHVAVGTGADGPAGPERAIGVVAAAQMREWLAGLAAAGFDADRLVPAPLLLPRPAEGWVKGELGGRGVVRGTAAGFADEGALTGLVTAGSPPAMLGPAEVEAALAAALAAPPLDLRQGTFARQRRTAISRALLVRLGWLLLAALSAALLADVARIVRLDLAAGAADAEADALARSALPAGETVSDPDRQLSARLAGMRGPGLGFTRTAAVVFGAVRQVAGTELTALDWSASGELRVSVSAQTEGQVAGLRDAIERAGLRTTPSTFTPADGRLTGAFTVSAP